ncbi:MAG TPA: thioredoxin [Firmicutes bacterium]|jgi:thioredoxin 1|nr:thioredoxin [Bacillota bacterium]
MEVANVSGNVLDVNESTFQTEVLESSKPVLVDFWAPWCGPCRMVVPVVEAVADEYADQLKVVKVNVDNNQNTAAAYGVMSIPTLAVFKNGEMVQRLVGYLPKKDLTQVIDEVL